MVVDLYDIGMQMKQKELTKTFQIAFHDLYKSISALWRLYLPHLLIHKVSN